MMLLPARFIFRDIKPDNILIDGNVKNGSFQVKVSDFGVATETSFLGDRTAETGTYRWMPPGKLNVPSAYFVLSCTIDGMRSHPCWCTGKFTVNRGHSSRIILQHG